MSYSLTLGSVSITASIAYSECVSVALVIQHSKRMRRTMSSVVLLDPPDFSILSHERHGFRKSY